MKGNHQLQTVASQPAALGASKYINKDGSKFITVPKATTSLDVSHPSPTTASMSSTPASKNPSLQLAADQEAGGSGAPPVNRKKAKRRAKQAAKAAAAAGVEHANGLPSPAASASQDSKTAAVGPGADYSDDEQSSQPSQHAQANGHAAGPPTAKSKKNSKKKARSEAPPTGPQDLHDPHSQSSSRSLTRAPSPPHHLDAHSHHNHHHSHQDRQSLTRATNVSKEKIWNTSSQEERERIKEFWLGLGEDERKSLVKVEKDAVLKKMKEQQKHTCSCTVCGRKRTAIEEELEGLYDAYYEELESFANQPNHHGEAPPMLGPSRHFGSSYAPQVSYPSLQQPSRGRIVEHVADDEDEEGEEEYSEDDLDEEEDFSDDEEPEDMHHHGDHRTHNHHHHHHHHHPTDPQGDFFNFGNSLTVQGTRFSESLNSLPPYAKSYMEQVLKYVFRRDVDPSLGGILTVADDLLKNDGKKFIEMMEQLAERRMAREEDAKDTFSRSYAHNNSLNGAGTTASLPQTTASSTSNPNSSSNSGHNYAAHNYPPPPPAPEDEDEYEDEEDEDYDSQEEYDEEEVHNAPSGYHPCHCTCHDGYHGQAEASTAAGAAVGLADQGQGQGQVRQYPHQHPAQKESQAKQPRHQQDTMTEEQRMEEGRRMFQIFAARMFEQRVLTAYREKVARERQDQLLAEIQAEEAVNDEKKAKKAKEAEKRKNKKQQQKQAQAEEKQRREEQRAADEAERLAQEQQRQEEARQKAEERRKKKESQKKAEEEEKQRKEAERQRRAQEARDQQAEQTRKAREAKEQQAEQARKAREAKEREKKAKEEARQREKTAREQKEREKAARELKEREARERDRLDKEAKAKAEKEARDKQKREERAAQKAAALASSAPPAAPVPITLVKRPSPHPSTIPALPQNPQSSMASPQIPVATPVIPKVPTPMRPRQPSQQEHSANVNASNTTSSAAAATAVPMAPQSGRTASQSSHPHSSNRTPEAATPAHTSPGPIGPPSKTSSSQGRSVHSQATSPLSSSIRPAMLPHGVGSQPFPLPPLGGLNFGPPPGMPNMPAPPGFPARMPNDPMFPTPVTTSYRAPGPPLQQAPLGLGMPIPHMNAPANRGFATVPPPGFSQTPELPSISTFVGSLPKEGSVHHTHSRQASAGFDSPSSSTAGGPIARPTPIGRPGSVVHGQRTASAGSPQAAWNSVDTEDFSSAPHLGSSALLDDDEPLQDFGSAPRRPGPPGGPASSAARGFPPVVQGPFGMDPTGTFGGSQLWGPPPPPQQFGGGLGAHGQFGGGPAPPPGFGPPAPTPWGAPASSTGPVVGFGPPGLSRPSPSRFVQVRLLLCRACQEGSEMLNKAEPAEKQTSGANSTAGDAAPADPDDDEARFVPIDLVKERIDRLGGPSDLRVEELVDMCETEGNPSNGGGSFDVRQTGPNAGTMDNDTAARTAQLSVRWTPGSGVGGVGGVGSLRQRALGAPGEIGSPVIGAGAPVGWGGK